MTNGSDGVLAVDRAISAKGRPGATSHGEIEQSAFRLFYTHGFEGTTVEAIAKAVGVSRRTLFRYYSSKNDIAWGRFDASLAEFAALLRSTPPDTPTGTAIRTAIRDFNDFPADAKPPHRDRMQLILSTPALQAHSALRYADWRRVVAEFVAERHGLNADDQLPRTLGHVALAVVLSAYESWLADESSSLGVLIDEASEALRQLVED